MLSLPVWCFISCSAANDGRAEEEVNMCLSALLLLLRLLLDFPLRRRGHASALVVISRSALSSLGLAANGWLSLLCCLELQQLAVFFRCTSW